MTARVTLAAAGSVLPAAGEQKAAAESEEWTTVGARNPKTVKKVRLAIDNEFGGVSPATLRPVALVCAR